MDEYQENLLLERFRRIKIIERSYTKNIWLLVNANSGEKAIAKIQPKSKLERTTQRNVLNEASYQQVMQGHIGIPFMYWSGVDDGEIMVILEYLGMRISDQLKVCEGKFSLQTTCMLGLETLKILQNYHSKGIIHRNIKPKNLQFGRGKKVMKLFFNDLIDSKRFRNKKNHQHIPYKQQIQYGFVNQFGSNNFKKGIEMSRRDDIQSVILMMIFFYTGVIPDHQNKFGDATYPSSFDHMLEEVRKIEFSAQPNYFWFVNKIKSILFHYSLQENHVYDWMKTKTHIDRLTIPKRIVSLKTELDLAKQKQFYDPFQAQIEIDDVSIRYYNKFESESEIGRKQHTVLQKKQLKQEERKEEQEVAVANRRKKTKGQCMVM